MRIATIATAILLALPGLAAAADIQGVAVTESPTGTRAEIALSAPADYTLIRLQGPDRLVVDLPASTLARGVTLPAGAGAIGRVRSGQPVPGTARLVFDLTQPVAALAPRVEQRDGRAVLVIEWPGDGVAVALTPPAPVATPVPNAPVAAAPASEVDPSKASSDATSRLIASMRAPATSAPAPVASIPPAAPPVTRVALPAPTPTLPEALAQQPAPVTQPPAATASVPPSARPTVTTVVPTRIATGVPTPTVAATRPTPGASIARAQGLRPLVIAIDPGHGGQDPGAVGLAGTREKDVTLAISRELARQINATPGLKAFLTREADMFIPLGQRARLARQAKADMFISIHADAAENRSAKGSSVYVLSLKGASSQRARWLADKENQSDLIGGARYKQADSMLTSVLLDLTQSGHMRASEDAGNEILGGLKRIGNQHKHHIERANFAVLRTSDMPSMLVETAFISNPDEERRLVDPAFQRQLARAVLDGVDTYFRQQPPPGTLYAAKAGEQAASVGGAP